MSQVAYGYVEALQFVQKCQIQSLAFAKHVDKTSSIVDVRFPTLEMHKVSVAAL